MTALTPLKNSIKLSIVNSRKHCCETDRLQEFLFLFSTVVFLSFLSFSLSVWPRIFFQLESLSSLHPCIEVNKVLYIYIYIIMYKFILKPMSIHTLYADAVQNADRVYHCDANSLPQTNKKEKRKRKEDQSINQFNQLWENKESMSLPRGSKAKCAALKLVEWGLEIFPLYQFLGSS